MGRSVIDVAPPGMKWIDGGKFAMGSDSFYAEERPVHRVAVDGFLAVAVLLGLVLNATAGWWWADPAAAYVLVYYALREGRAALSHG